MLTLNLLMQTKADIVVYELTRLLQQQQQQLRHISTQTKTIQTHEKLFEKLSQSIIPVMHKPQRAQRVQALWYS